VNPLDLRSQNGVLSVDLALRNAPDPQGFMHVCYDYQASSGRIEAPTLRLNPGDELIIHLADHLVAKSLGGLTRVHGGMEMPSMMQMPGMSSGTPANPCEGGLMTAASSNIHFHGLNIRPICHSDEVIKPWIVALATRQNSFCPAFIWITGLGGMPRACS